MDMYGWVEVLPLGGAGRTGPGQLSDWEESGEGEGVERGEEEGEKEKEGRR